MHTEAELAYLAGIIDGEGFVDGERCCFVLCMADVQILEWCLEHFGGSLSGEFVPESSNSRPRRMWALRRIAGLAEVAPRLLPYLVLKRREVEVLVEILALGPGPRGAAAKKDTGVEWHRRRKRLNASLREAMLARKS